MTELVVNECRVFATNRGADWWVMFRAHQPGRFTDLVVSMAGNMVGVACEDREHAEWLRDHMISVGIPASALRIRKAA
jgi:hypothetical protein